MRINYSSSIQTLAYDAPIEMEIAKSMKAMLLFFGIFVIVYKVH